MSQFTLYGDTAKGRRPSWIAAARPETAEPLVERVVERLRALGARVETGRFRTDMRVELVNDGPVTLCVDVELDAGRTRATRRTSTSSATMNGPSPRFVYQVWPSRSSTGREEHALFAHRGALQHVAVGVDDRGEPGRRGLHDPAAVLDRRADDSTRPAGSARSCPCSSPRWWG